MRKGASGGKHGLGQSGGGVNREGMNVQHIKKKGDLAAALLN
jgi:hypothetical protein